MCIATVYDNSANKEMLLQDVVSLDIDNEKVLLTTILGERKSIDARIKHIDFLKHNIIIEPSKQPTLK